MPVAQAVWALFVLREVVDGQGSSEWMVALLLGTAASFYFLRRQRLQARMFSFYFAHHAMRPHSDLRTPRISSSLQRGASCISAQGRDVGEKNRKTKGKRKTQQKANAPEHEQFFVVNLDLHAAVLWKQHLIRMSRSLPT